MAKAGNGRGRSEERANLIWAIAHPVRRRILRALSKSKDPRSPMQLSRSFELPLSAVAYHVNILRKFGGVKLTDERMARGAVEHFYETTIDEDPPIEALLDETRLADEDE